MLRVPIIQARPGMTLAQPVFHPDRPDRVLLRTGYALDETSIDRLREMRLPEVWVRYPDLQFIGRWISPRVMRARGAVARVLRDVVDDMSREAEPLMDYGRFRSVVRGFTHTLEENRSAALMIQSMFEGNEPLVRHSTDVCYLSLLMGMTLESYLVDQRDRMPARRARDIADLGMAALLHDVGMLGLEDGVLDRWIAEGCGETDRAWRRHVLIGYEMTKDELGTIASTAILHHHQKFDGSGFPLRRRPDGTARALRGEEIHIFARILLAADLFDRLRRPMGTGRVVPPVVALKAMTGAPYRDWLDPVVFRGLLGVAPAYPPGSLVTLSSGERAAVVDFSPATPCRPEVLLLPTREEGGGSWDWDTDGAPRVDLAERPELSIVEADGEDVSSCNFDIAAWGHGPGETSEEPATAEVI